MPVYFFHIREGEAIIRDSDGIDLVDEAAAHAHAVKGARSLLSTAVLEGRLPLDHSIIAIDESGRQVLEITYREAVASK